MKKRFMVSEMGPKSILSALDRVGVSVVDGMAAAMEIDVSGTPQERRKQVVSALNDDAEALSRLLLKIEPDIFELVREVVERGSAVINIVNLIAHSASADSVSFLVPFFPDDASKDGTNVHYLMPADEGLCGNVRRLFADESFLARRKRADGMRRFLVGISMFYGAVDRIDLDKVLDAIGAEVASGFGLGASVSASEVMDFVANGILQWDFGVSLRKRPNGLGEYLVPVEQPRDKKDARYFDALLLQVLEGRSGKPVKMPTVDELLQLSQGGEYDYIETDEGDDLFDFLIDELGYDEEFGTDILGFAATHARMGTDLGLVLKYLDDDFGFVIPTKRRQADRFLALFGNYLNSVPTWGNYGASAAEMHEWFGSSDSLEMRWSELPGGVGALGEEDDCGDGEDSGRPWNREESEEDTPAEKLVPSVYPDGPVDFRWVKDAEEKRRRLEEYDWLRPVLMAYAYEHLTKCVEPKERKQAEKALGIGAGAEPDLDRVRMDFAANIQLHGGTNARLRAIERKGEMTPAYRVASDYYANYSYAWLKILAMKAAVGVKCLNLLSGEELFLMEKSLSMNPRVKGMTLCIGIAPMDGNRYVAVGHALLADFEMPERFLADTLKNAGIAKSPPCALTPEEQEKLAVATIRRIAGNPLRIRIGIG